MMYSSYAVSVDFSKDQRVHIFVKWECEDGFDGTNLSISAEQMRRLLDGEIDNIHGSTQQPQGAERRRS